MTKDKCIMAAASLKIMIMIFESWSNAASWNRTCLLPNSSPCSPPLLNRDTLWLPATLQSHSAVCLFQCLVLGMEESCGLTMTMIGGGVGDVVMSHDHVTEAAHRGFGLKPATFWSVLSKAHMCIVSQSDDIIQIRDQKVSMVGGATFTEDEWQISEDTGTSKTPKPQKALKTNQKPTTTTSATDAKLLTNQCSRLWSVGGKGRAH